MNIEEISLRPGSPYMNQSMMELKRNEKLATNLPQKTNQIGNTIVGQKHNLLQEKMREIPLKEKEKMLTAKITKATEINYLLRIAENLHESSSDTDESIKMNGIHWSAWYNKMTDLALNLKYPLNGQYHSRLETITEIFLKSLKTNLISLNAGQNAIIIHAIGTLQIQNTPLKRILHHNALQLMEKCDVKEIDMLFKQVHNCFSEDEITPLQLRLESFLTSDMNKEFFNKLSPCVITTLLNIANKCKKLAEPSSCQQMLLVKAKKDFTKFDDKEKGRLLSGLRIFYPTLELRDFFKEIELSLLNQNNKKSLLYACSNFVKLRYIPLRVIASYNTNAGRSRNSRLG